MNRVGKIQFTQLGKSGLSLTRWSLSSPLDPQLSAKAAVEWGQSARCHLHLVVSTVSKQADVRKVDTREQARHRVRGLEMRPPRILSDIRISQSPTWRREVVCLHDLRAVPPGLNLTAARSTVASVCDLFHILRLSADFDVIVNADIRTGQLFALVRWLFRLRRPKHIMLELMLDEERDDALWRLKRYLQRLVFSTVDVSFVSSTREAIQYAKRFGIDAGRFRFLPFHTNVTEPRIVQHSERYILSAGMTGRDYATLCAAARGMHQRFVVVSDRASTRGLEFPENVDVLYDVPYSKYLGLLENCRFVVVPLKKLVKSTGQVALLEAMALGKPVVATETTGTVDYIESGINGLLVPVGDHLQLRRAIEALLGQPDLHRTLASNALESVRQHHTFEAYANRIIQTAKDILGRPS
jgi:glycosyltransferase involved in cell wall biosynthesis